MSPAPLIAQAYLDPETWIHISEAATRLQMHEGSLRRTCQALAERQPPDARQAKPPGGGKMTWYLRRGYHPDLRAVPQLRISQPPTNALMAVSDRKRLGALHRVEAVKMFRARREHDKRQIQEWLPELLDVLRAKYPDIGVSRSRLYAWDKQYKFEADVTKLIDGRGGDSSTPPDQAAVEFFRTRYLGSQRTKVECWRETRDEARRQDWRWTSYSTLVNYFSKFVTEDDEYKHRHPTLHRNRFAPYMQIDPESQDVGVVWLGDHSQMDFWVRYRDRLIRPWVTVWVDWRSRRVCGWVMCESPNSSTIMAALRHGLLDPVSRGGPGICYIDNGKDYDAWCLQGQTKAERRASAVIDHEAPLPGLKGLTPGDHGLFGLLDIEVAHTNPYAARSKGRCERWFGVMHEQFDRSWPTYCGRNPENRPEDLQDWMKAKAHLIPTFDEARAAFAKFVQGYNASAEHAKEDMAGMSPDGMYETRCRIERRLVDPIILDMLCQKWMRTVTVGRNGITIYPFGPAMSYGQTDRWLDQFKARDAKDRPELRVSYDPDAMETIRVWTRDWKYLGTAQWNGYATFAPGSRLQESTMRAVIAEERKAAKTEKAARQARNLRYTSAAERAAVAQYAADNPPPPPSAPDAIRLVQTPADAAVRDFKRHQVRQAVGAEVLGLDTPLGPTASLKPSAAQAGSGAGADVFGLDDLDVPLRSWASAAQDREADSDF